jgi:hypothetical protein
MSYDHKFIVVHNIKHYSMSQSSHNRLVLIVVLCLLHQSSAQLCSTLCSPGMCSGPGSNECITSCPTDWILVSSTCSVDPSSGFTLIGTTADLSGPTVATVSPSGTSPCGMYSFYGDQSCKSKTYNINLASGIGVPHYSYKVEMWVIMLRSAYWTSTNSFTLSDGSSSQLYSLGSPSGQEIACNSDTQSYFRLTWFKTHINQTSSAIALALTIDNTQNNCRWGVKEVVVTAQTCHTYCLTCSGPSST